MVSDMILNITRRERCGEVGPDGGERARVPGWPKGGVEVEVSLSARS
jgi:hypothetical protein